jgi:hypothetical protein
MAVLHGLLASTRSASEIQASISNSAHLFLTSKSARVRAGQVWRPSSSLE